MWHVDDGALHAYLDGALDAYPAAEARRIREHLEHCGECASRLAAEREIREEATAILSDASVPVDMPPLEELRARARMPEASEPVGASTSARRLYRIGWAASIAVAVGVGWMARGGQLATTTSAPLVDGVFERPGSAPASGLPSGAAGTATPQSPPPPADGPGGGESEGSGLVAQDRDADAAVPVRGAAGSGVRPVEGLAGEAPPATAERFVDAPAPERSFADSLGRPAQEGRRRADTDSRMAVLDVTDAAERARPAPDSLARLRAAAAQPNAANAVEAEVRGAPERDALLDAVVSASDSLRARLSTTEAERQRVPRERVASSADDVRTLQLDRAPAALAPIGLRARVEEEARSERERAARDEREAARADEPGPLGVPGLETISIDFLGDASTPTGTRVLQRLERGDTLELVHLPEGVDPPALAPIDDEGRTVVAAPRDGGWVILRARLDRAALETLLERLDSGR